MEAQTGTGWSVLTISQLHFELVPGSTSDGPPQTSPELLLQTEQVLTSKKPSPSPSAQTATIPVTGNCTEPLTSPQASPSCGGPAAIGSTTSTVQSSFVDASGSMPM